MPTHPLWNRFEVPTVDEIEAARVGARAAAPVVVVEPDPAWAEAFAVVAGRLREALDQRALGIEHVGSTAVPGLRAKPVIDVDLTVADSGAEDEWLPDLERAGFTLRVREPEWEEHRMVRGEGPRCNVHVFSVGARELRRHLMFRDWLRTHPEDRDAYGALKCDLADRGFTDAMLYNNAKAGFVYDLYETIFAADPEHDHEPQGR